MKKVILLFISFVIPLISFTQSGKIEYNDDELKKQTSRIVVDSEVLKCYVGTYLLHTDTFDMIAEITLKNNRVFYYEKRGDSTFEAELYPLSINRFIFKENNAIIHFNNTMDCRTPSFNIYINDKSYKCVRKE